MVQKAIHESTGKQLLVNWAAQQTKQPPSFVPPLCAPVFAVDQFHHEHPHEKDDFRTEHPKKRGERVISLFGNDSDLVVKVDQLIKRRGHLGLVLVKKSWEEANKWIESKSKESIHVSGVDGRVDSFIVEKFVPHKQEEEMYVCIQSARNGDEILFYHEGGVDVGDVDSKATRFLIPVGAHFDAEICKKNVLQRSPLAPEIAEIVAAFIADLYRFFVELHFSYLEINPLVVTGGKVYLLDMAAKLDADADFLMRKQWGEIEFPAPFGRPETPEEAYISSLDAKTGASLKLTVLNESGRIWLMVAGGGASVVYADTICDMGGAAELANYGEYSGDPPESLTFEYARTILKLVTRHPHPGGKALLIGGGVANFTDVAETFKGIIRALVEYKDELIEQKVRIYVRRGGPNFQEGLRRMKETAVKTGLFISVFGPEEHLTSIIPMALKDVLNMDVTRSTTQTVDSISSHLKSLPSSSASSSSSSHSSLFTPSSVAFVYGMQVRAVQSMLDFDYLCHRHKPSVAGIIYGFGGQKSHKFYWGSKEIFIPIFSSVSAAAAVHPEVDVVVNFASFRAVAESMEEIFNVPQIKTVAIIAEGVPEQIARQILHRSRSKGVNIIGPATVGGIQSGVFRIGNAGGAMDNVVACKLYRAGSVGYVARSGGLSNEMNNIVARNTDGVAEGIAIGGDRFPSSSFIDHLLRMQNNNQVKILLLLGEVGGVEEYDVCEAIKDGRITKPVVAWCTGTCARMFSYDVQFGHAGASASSANQSAAAKNAALRAAGAIVPDSFNELPLVLKTVFDELVKSGQIAIKDEIPPPVIPMDYNWAVKMGCVRRPTNFVTSISDDRGEEVLYAGVPLSQLFAEGASLGDVISLLWFKKRLPSYAAKYLEMILMVVSDHGPCVSGAHNSIVAARAGVQLVPALCSGLLTVGPRFGGAIDDAAAAFTRAFDSGITPDEFVEQMRKAHALIPGIGHRVKSRENPDLRVEILKQYARSHFKRGSPLLDYALQVESITVRKRANLILNVDGCIAVTVVDLLRQELSRKEADELVSWGCMNALFVVGRSIGLIGHIIDQRRLGEGLYRHPADDVSFVLPHTHGARH